MITDKDIIKLKEVFATKDDLERFSTKEDLLKTNTDLKNLSDRTDQGFSWVIQEFVKVRSEMAELFAEQNKKMATKSDLSEIMGELRAIREELTVSTYRRVEMTKSIESHETRITTLENNLSFPK